MKIIRISQSRSENKLCVSIDGDYANGNVIRSEGGKSMHLRSTRFNLEVEGVDTAKIHNDIVALIAILVFHPVLPVDEEFILEFTFPISHSIEKAVRRPFILPKVIVKHLGIIDEYQHRRIGVLSYGGGFDSLAAHILLPDFLLVHQSPASSKETTYKDVVNQLLPQITKNHSVVFDNMRTMYSEWGLPLWVSVYVSSLIFSPKYIFSGSEMTGTYLDGGKGYRPRHKNRWYEVFKSIGVNVLPTSFLSEVGNAKIVSEEGMIEKAAYCAIISNRDCGKCTKCLRRRLLRAALSTSDNGLLEDFQRTPQIEAFLSKRPLYYSDVFTQSARMIQSPNWVTERLADLTETSSDLSFHQSYYPSAFDDFEYPNFIKEEVVTRLSNYGIHPFSQSETDAFLSYSCSTT